MPRQDKRTGVHIFARIFGMSKERGHSCPQQLSNAQCDRNVQELDENSMLLRTRMSALRFGSGYGNSCWQPICSVTQQRNFLCRDDPDGPDEA